MFRNHAGAAALYKIGLPAVTFNEDLPQLTLVGWNHHLLGGFEDSTKLRWVLSFRSLECPLVSKFVELVETFGRGHRLL